LFVNDAIVDINSLMILITFILIINGIVFNLILILI